MAWARRSTGSRSSLGLDRELPRSHLQLDTSGQEPRTRPPPARNGASSPGDNVSLFCKASAPVAAESSFSANVLAGESPGCESCPPFATCPFLHECWKLRDGMGWRRLVPRTHRCLL